jgi:CubicO group peptidase (beta-lactamase class C family)
MSAAADRTGKHHVNWRNGAAIGLTLLLLPNLTSAADADLLESGPVLEAFVDGVMARELAAGDMVGAVVAVVKNGRVLLAKGYGQADLETGRRAHGERTLFRIGSISKALIWIAVAQQYQEGQLRLDDEVNAHLSEFQIPDTYPVPITLEHLLTHSAGFEDRVLGLFARGRRTVGSFQERLVTMLPARVALPGREAVYSNYGSALAARLVEQSSGMAWDEYVQRRIFRPLNMTRSTMRQPPPEPLDDAVAEGYIATRAGWQRVPFEFLTLAPVGAASSTASDMALLLVELLKDVETPVLTNLGRQMMFRPGLANDDRLNRMLHGFYQRNSHGQRIVGQHGETRAFRSDLLLYPELDLGLFVSFNAGQSAPLARFTEAFNDRLFGRPKFHGEPPGERGRQFAGFYASLRTPHTSVAKAYGYLSMLVVEIDPHGFLQLRQPSRGVGPARLAVAEPGVFQAIDGSARIAFSETEAGVMRASLNEQPYLVYQRVPGWLEPSIQIGGLLASALVFSGVLVWPVGMARHRGRELHWGERWASLLAIVNVGILSAFFVVIVPVLGDPVELLFGMPARLESAMWLPVIAALLVLVQSFVVVSAWTNGFWWPLRRIHYTLLTLVSGLLIAWCGYWNLVALTPSRLVG